jgi:hypothetical protein
MFKPLFGTPLDSQRVRQQTYEYAEGKDEYGVESSEQNSRLKGSDRVSGSLPRVPDSFEHEIVLEQRVNKRPNSGTLCQKDNCTAQEQGDQHGHEPPSLLRPKEGE